jgi:DNA-directed RNA polymerase alpha subunit
MTNNEIPDTDTLTEIKNCPVMVLGLSNRTVNPLINAGVNTLADLFNIRAKGYENIKNFGDKAKNEIEKALSDFIQHPVPPVDPRPLEPIRKIVEKRDVIC